MASESIVGIVIQARDEATPGAAAHPMTSGATLEAIRALIRAELRRRGFRPPMPLALGAWRWDIEADAWTPLLGGGETREAQETPANRRV